MVEHLRNVAYQVGADPVVSLRRDHPVILSKPRVVGRGKVHLRYRLQPHRAKPPQLGLQLFNAPRALDRELRVAWVHHALGKPYDDHVVALRRHRVRHFAPHVFIKAKLIRDRMFVVPLVLWLLRWIQRLCMRVRAELHHHRSNLRLLLCRVRRAKRESECAARRQRESANPVIHDVLLVSCCICGLPITLRK